MGLGKKSVNFRYKNSLPFTEISGLHGLECSFLPENLTRKLIPAIDSQLIELIELIEGVHILGSSSEPPLLDLHLSRPVVVAI